jgi:hypothetical protein
MGSLGSAAVCSWLLAAARGAGGAVWRATVCAASLVHQKHRCKLLLLHRTTQPIRLLARELATELLDAVTPEPLLDASGKQLLAPTYIREV